MELKDLLTLTGLGLGVYILTDKKNTIPNLLTQGGIREDRNLDVNTDLRGRIIDAPAPNTAPSTYDFKTAVDDLRDVVIGPVASAVMSSDEAYRWIQAGQYQRVRDAKMSHSFKWGDFFHNRTNLQMRTATRTVLQAGVKLAATLEWVRKIFGGKSITITSWYRDPATNKSTPGAASNSQHLYGGAADFMVQGVAATEVYRRLDPIHNGGLGRYGGSRGNITHIDVRGYRARWYHA